MNLSKSSNTDPAGGRQLQGWVWFCLGILLIKVLFFAIDPLPKFSMGDSGAYIHTAMTGWMPEARSYFYGYVIRWSSVGIESLNGLLVLQLFLSAVASIIAARIGRVIFRLSPAWAYLLGLLCALDPLQLLYERYVMTEAISLFLYAVLLHRSFLYIRDHRLRDLALLQMVSVLLIGFRMSYLLLVQLNTILLPFLAFSGEIWRALRRRGGETTSRWQSSRLLGAHLLVSILLMFLLHLGYKHANGWISHRPPAYLHATGVTLLAYLSPILEPEDTSDPDLANLIRHGSEMGLKDVHLRNNQRFSPGYLIDRFSKLHPERSGAERIAKEATLNALRRNPLGVARIAWPVYRDYWSADAMKQSAEGDFGADNPPGDDLIALLRNSFHLALPKEVPTDSVLQRYYVSAWPYYFVLVVAPFLALLAVIWRSTRNYALLLFIHMSLIVTVSVTFGGHSIRYFQPVSFATFLVIAILAKGLLGRSGLLPGRRRSEEEESPNGPERLLGHARETGKGNAENLGFLALDFPSRIFALRSKMRHRRELVA